MPTQPTKGASPLLRVKNVKKHFLVTNSLGRVTGKVKAVDNISFEVRSGETYGLVGESGCGKSTTGRTIMRLIEPTDGEAIYRDKNIYQLKEKELLEIRRAVQMVFQDPYSSLNPRKRVGHILEETLKIHHIGNKKERMDRVMSMLNVVGFQPEQYFRYPHEFSGGQRQRIGLARALMVNPELIICDEPVSALDVSIQSQVLNLLNKIQREFNLSYLFISHDLSVVRHISDRIGVMYLGKIVEEAITDELYKNPLHPYTQALFSAVPIANPELKRERITLKGEVPSPLNPPDGCVFHTRCPYAIEKCKREIPMKKMVAPNHAVACHLYN